MIKNAKAKNGYKCASCGTELTYVNRLEGLPCNHTCCGCCEWRYARDEPCPKEKLDGTALEQLVQLQNKGK